MNERSFWNFKMSLAHIEIEPQQETAADQRIGAILAAARLAFIEKGFDGASMQDLARAAGMSVGNFYRYFASKAAIVEALIAQDLCEMEQDFQAVLSAADPLAAMRAQARTRLLRHQCSNDGALWAEITATALRKPDIGLACLRMDCAIQSYLTQAFAAVTGRTLSQAQIDFGAHAALVILLIKSSAMLPPQNDAMRAGLNDLILKTIDQTLDEIAASNRKPELCA
jgi:AcrR family transcriptional regulator